MTPERLAELEKLCNAATPGPWREGDGSPESLYHGPYAVIGVEDDQRCVLLECNTYFGNKGGDNGRLIAAARTALPEAIAEIRRLQALLGEQLQGVARSVAENAAMGHVESETAQKCVDIASRIEELAWDVYRGRLPAADELERLNSQGIFYGAGRVAREIRREFGLQERKS